jgi:hypothetical protein
VFSCAVWGNLIGVGTPCGGNGVTYYLRTTVTGEVFG